MTQPLIELYQVSKRYGQQQVLQDLSFHVHPGEVVGLLGPNGSGKTTTVRLLNGVIRPDQGAITVSGYNPAHDGDNIRRLSGILTESAGFYPHMTGLENLKFFSDLYGVTDRRRPLELLEEFGLSEAGDKQVGTYSTGMKKRLGLARALLHRPSILFLDEPTNGLDPEGIRMVLEAIVRLNRRDGTTMILCSHLLQQLEQVCHRYLFIQGGRLIEQGTMAELEEKYRGERMLEVETDQGRVTYPVADRAAIPDLLRRLTQETNVYGAALKQPDLESIYFKIRGGKQA